MLIKPVKWSGNRLLLLDQTQLPEKVVWKRMESVSRLCEGIRALRVRGAPAIGVAAAYGVALGAACARGRSLTSKIRAARLSIPQLAATRPTARNLFWALERMREALERAAVSETTSAGFLNKLLAEARSIQEEDLRASVDMARHGARLFKSGDVILTHCNTGGLATAGGGTALGVVAEAWKLRKGIRVYADESRPLLQGSRLTAWELMRAGIPVTLICDSTAASLMRAGVVTRVILGADRIAANGDVANKVGTYSVAVNAKYHGIPFYVAAPWSTVDLSLNGGDEIQIEERGEEEVTRFGLRRTAPKGVKVYNPAFDITPNALVSAIITDRGVVERPYRTNLKRLHRKFREPGTFLEGS
ncbi:MAG: S-methyl-5-thioribose-1-phosphate isomerase [Candidatus Omnitrophica bacterium]|nr:S-methyl-5-thioribose-1-phosphate isomerase [Candidatus Omnitrophota bacterium]